MSSYFFRQCLGFSHVLIFGFHDRAGLSGCCGQGVLMQSVGKERSAYRHLFLCLVQYRTRSKCPSFSCKDFFLTVLKCMFMLMNLFNSTLDSVSSPSQPLTLFHIRGITCDRPGNADA
jgi:hypothetical protein